MESDPFALVEAMTIAGYATGCEQGFIYVRGEYPLAHARLAERDRAGARARAARRRRPGQRPRFDIELRRGAGAYICGEETALFNSIEGYRGEPRNKPPFPVEVGPLRQADGREQRRDARQRARHRARRRRRVRGDRHRAARPARSSSASPATSRGPGVYEVPFGTTLRELLDARRRRRGGRRCRRCCSAARPGAFVGARRSSTCRSPSRARAPPAHARLRASSWSSTTRPTCATSCCGSPRSSATSRAASACPAASAPCARRRRCTGSARPAAADGGRARAARRPRAGDARRLDLRPRPDRVRARSSRRSRSCGVLREAVVTSTLPSRIVELTVDGAAVRGARGRDDPRRLPAARASTRRRSASSRR